jgi:type I restriction enzyme S subunit
VTPLIYSFDKRFFKWLLEIKNLNILGSSTGQPVISGSKIYPVEVSLPSFDEQVEIVRILETKLTSVDMMEAEIEAALARAEALRQAILKRAFSGQLVAQDSADEPASIVLERIRLGQQSGEAIRMARRRPHEHCTHRFQSLEFLHDAS